MSHKNNNKVTTMAYWQQQNNPVDDVYGAAVPILIFNDKGQIALISHDNAPFFRVFGNGFTYGETPRTNKKGQTHYDPVAVILPKGEKAKLVEDNDGRRVRINKSADDISLKKPGKKGIYYDQAVSILGRETNLPINLREKIVPVMNYRLNLEGTRTERNRVFAVNIGKFPLESKKGAFVDWFDLDNLPQNTNSNHGELVKYYVELQKLSAMREYKEQKEFYVAFDAPPQANPTHWRLDGLMATGGEIANLKKWREHPIVEAKRAAGKLSRDPIYKAQGKKSRLTGRDF
jgi:hypothetical protein